MKKLLSLITLSALLLSGCGTESASNAIANPYEIMVDGDILSFYDDAEKFEENGFEVFEDNLYSALTSENNCISISTYNKNAVAAINICDENIKIYKSLHVGENAEKIESFFDKYKKEENTVTNEVFYTILFNDDNEEINSLNNVSDGTYLSFKTYESIISQIVIERIKLI